MWKHLEVELDYLVRRATFCGWQIAPRRISNYELVYVLRGQGDICLGSPAVYGPNRGSCVLLSRRTAQSFRCAAALPWSSTESISRCRRAWTAFRCPRLPKSNRPAGWSLCSNLCLRSTSKKHIFINGGKIFCSSRSYAKYSSCTHGENAPAELIRIKKVLEHIHEDPARPFTLEDLTARSGVKKTLFLQSFRRMTGTTPKQYILGLRLEYARDLLLETDVPVAQVAERCGFSDSFYFSRCFKNHFSTSPRQYRKEHA